MKILITGSSGFIGKNLVAALNRREDCELMLFDRECSQEQLAGFVAQADFIFHVAGINRPKNVSEFYQGNTDFTKMVLGLAEKCNHKIPVLLTSSIQVEQDNDYGKSKLAAESLIQAYGERNDVPVFIYRLPNVFGKWCKPEYNSVIATWCHKITRNLPLKINDRSTSLSLVYIDDVISSFLNCLTSVSRAVFHTVPVVYEKTLGEIESLLHAFKESRETLLVPPVGRGFERALYGTYLSYLPTDAFSYELKGHSDPRGTFYEILKTVDSGQFSISTSKSGVTRGNHYHDTKNEKFLVIRGEALIELRNIFNDEVIQYHVSEKKIEIVEMITGYTHSITNTGDTEMVLLIWANEAFDRDHPDTNFLKV
jgi:UDP-2-acetamido-2,6-beta-L-arabino-hexul-4-ose reductase